MNISLKTIVSVSLLVCIFVESINGFSVGRYRTKRYIRKRIDKNGFDATAAVKNLRHGYEYVSSFFNKGRDKDAKISASGVGSSPLSGRLNSADCDDCFLGMQVSRREAYVVCIRNCTFR